MDAYLAWLLGDVHGVASRRDNPNTYREGRALVLGVARGYEVSVCCFGVCVILLYTNVPSVRGGERVDKGGMGEAKMSLASGGFTIRLADIAVTFSLFSFCPFSFSFSLEGFVGRRMGIGAIYCSVPCIGSCGRLRLSEQLEPLYGKVVRLIHTGLLWKQSRGQKGCSQ